MKVLLIIPPFTQVNTPYPSTAQLAGFLQKNNIEAVNLDLSIKVILEIFSAPGLKKIFNLVNPESNDVKRMLSLSDKYLEVIGPVIEFLQGKNPNLAYSIVNENFLPQSDAFTREVNETALFGGLGIQDKAKYYSSLMLEDLINLIKYEIDTHFGFSRYAERLSQSLPDFKPLEDELGRKPNIIEEFIINETIKAIEKEKPELVCYSVPFPGNILGALISARTVKKNNPDIKIALGGGYINTELRNLKDTTIFKYVDFITYDDGELPLLNLENNLKNISGEMKWVRTLVCQNNKLLWLDDANQKNVKHNELCAPSYKGINPDDYLSMTEMLNPMHRLWSDGYWNKLTVAHGCYWHRCTFCDTTLDYIGRYEPAKAAVIVDWIEDLIKQTNRRSFHFTDEAAPPKLLKEIALELLRRKVKINWWGNIRFENSFSPDLCRLLAASGCIAVTGGIEVADYRLLKLIQKGITIEQAANVCSNFKSAGIMVHAYLMYGFPTETEQELINSLEIVRQFFQQGLLQSGFWHQFALTCHSPVAKEPAKFGVEILSPLENNFANNDLQHSNKTGLNYNNYSAGLKKAIYNFMHGIGIDWPVENWFDIEILKPKINKNLILNYVSAQPENIYTDSERLVWTGGKPLITKGSNGETVLEIHTSSAAGEWEMQRANANWLANTLTELSTVQNSLITFQNFKESFPGSEKEFEKFISSETWAELRELGLLLI